MNNGPVTFTISNTGALALNLTGTPIVSISGANAGDFTINTQPTTPVAIGGNATFSVTFNPSALGTRTATLSIPNSSGNAPAYTMILTGVGYNALCNSGTVFTVGPGYNYTNLTAVAAALNTTTILTCNVVFELQSNYTSLSEIYPIQFNQFATYGNYTAIIRPAASTTQTTSGNPGSSDLIELNGVSNLVFDGRPHGVGSTGAWTITNTSTTSGGNVIDFTNGAQQDTLKYLTITGATSASTYGLVSFTNPNGTTGNSNNTVKYCNIGCLDNSSTNYQCIYSNGSSNYNSSNNILYNNLYNYTFAGLQLTSNSGPGWNITGNSFYRTTAGGSGYQNSNNLYPQYAIFIQSTVTGSATAYDNSMTISGNYIGGTAPQCGGTAMADPNMNYYAIFAELGNGLTSTISNNKIQNINFTETSGFTGIYLSRGNANITGNYIGLPYYNSNLAINLASPLIVTGIWLMNGGFNTSSANSVTISNNNIGNIYQTGGGASAQIIGINASGNCNVSIVNNKIDSLFTNGTVTYSPPGGSAVLAGITLINSSATRIGISGNTIRNLSGFPKVLTRWVYTEYIITDHLPDQI